MNTHVAAAEFCCPACLPCRYVLYDTESGKYRPIDGRDLVLKKKKLKKVLSEMLDGTEAEDAIKTIITKVTAQKSEDAANSKPGESAEGRRAKPYAHN